MYKLGFLCVFILLAAVHSFQAAEIQKPASYVKIEGTKIGTAYVTPEGRFEVSNDMLAWVDAAKECNKIGMKLVTPDSPSKNDIIKDFLIDNGHNDKYWTSANMVYDLWYWTSIGTPVSYTDWARGEPNEFLEDDCMYLETIGWSDSDCATDYNYICE